MQFHGIRGKIEPRAERGDSRNIYRQPASDGNLAKERAAHGPLRHIDGAECGDPSLGGRKALSQIRAAKAGHDHRFAGSKQAIYYGGFIVGQADAAFAIGDAHKNRGNRDVVCVRRRKLCGFGAHKARVHANARQ